MACQTLDGATGEIRNAVNPMEGDTCVENAGRTKSDSQSPIYAHREGNNVVGTKQLLVTFLDARLPGLQIGQQIAAVYLSENPGGVPNDLLLPDASFLLSFHLPAPVITDQPVKEQAKVGRSVGLPAPDDVRGQG